MKLRVLPPNVVSARSIYRRQKYPRLIYRNEGRDKSVWILCCNPMAKIQYFLNPGFWKKKKRERKKWTKSVCHRSVGKVEAREFFRLHDRRVVHVGNENGKSFSQQGCVCARAKVTIKGKNRLATFPFSLFSFTGETQPVERRIDRRNAFVSRRGTSRPDRSRIPRFWNGRCSVSTWRKKRHTPEFPPKGQTEG